MSLYNNSVYNCRWFNDNSYEGKEPHLTFSTMVCTLSVLSPLATDDEKVRALFDAFDMIYIIYIIILFY